MVVIAKGAPCALPDSAATPEHAFFKRWRLLAGLGGAIASTALPGLVLPGQREPGCAASALEPGA